MARSTTGRRLGSLSALAALAVLSGAQAPGPAHASEPRVALGMYTAGAPERRAAIDAYAKKAGHDPAVISWYRFWTTPAFLARSLRNAESRGALPLITWEPWTPEHEGVPLRAIARGDEDAYLRSSAREAAAWRKPIFVRFAHEMNGDWVPWGLEVGGNTARDYIAAWRHIVRVFRREGASDVRWVWSPHASPQGNLPFRRLYPGDRWVDWVALDGFNWGGGLGWRSFSEIFASSYEALTRMTSKPVMIAETGSAEQQGRDKAAWISSTFERELPGFDRVRAVVWFNDTHGERVDWRIDSSPQSLAAFRAATSSRRYRAGPGSLLAPAVRAVEPAAITPPEGGFGGPSLATRVREELGERKAWVIGLGAAALLLAALALARLRHRRRAASRAT